MAKVWCFILGDEGDYSKDSIYDFNGSKVGNPQKYHLYETPDDNVDLGEDGTLPLYHAANDKIDANDLSIAATQYFLTNPVAGRSGRSGNDDHLTPLDAGMFASLQNALAYLSDDQDDDFDLTEKILEIAADVQAGMDNPTLKSKHGIKAPEANAIRKIVTT